MFDPFTRFKFEFDDDAMLKSCIIPKQVETCVCCGKRLFVDATGWDKGDDDVFWTPVDLDIECERGLKCYKEYEDSEYWRMPYVYWLPVTEHCRRWINAMLEVYFGVRPVPLKWLEKNGQIRLFADKS